MSDLEHPAGEPEPAHRHANPGQQDDQRDKVGARHGHAVQFNVDTPAGHHPDGVNRRRSDPVGGSPAVVFGIAELVGYLRASRPLRDFRPIG